MSRPTDGAPTKGSSELRDEARFYDANGPLIFSIVDAFLSVQDHSWPHDAIRHSLRSASFRLLPPAEAVRTFVSRVEALGEVHPSLRVFWKDDHLRFLGMSATLAREAGFPSMPSVVGLTDADERFPWSRQAAKYQRDDRAVMSAQVPELDILERQDAAGEATRWLRTSKAPILHGGRVAGILGAFDVLTTEQAKALAAKARR